MQDLEAISLLKKYLAGNCTEQERGLLETWYLQYYQQDLPDLSETSRQQLRQEVWAALPNHTKEETQNPIRKKFNFLPYISAAAILIVFSCIGLYVYKVLQTVPKPVDVMTAAATIAPGKYTASLTLVNGKTINLSDTKTGVVVNADETKYNDGTAIPSSLRAEVKQSQLVVASTPLGGTYQFTLPDGTKVWLNAASTLKFPSSFAGLISRKVELIGGEAYFEVSKDKSHPFIVTSNGQQVEVLGTHFNINAYNDDGSTKTTLEEGSVRVSSSTSLATLKPGQQSILNSNTIKVSSADLETTLAWKNGLFSFTDADVKTIMPQIARWYNINIEYAGDIPKDLITGGISRQSNLATVLKMLEMVHLKFSLTAQNGKQTLIISP